MNRLSKNRADQVAYSRFLKNESVSLEELIEESVSHCSQLVKGRHVLSIQDSSDFNYKSHADRLDKSDEDLGPLGAHHSIGFFLHPSLVVDAVSQSVLGFSDIHLWNRDYDDQDKHERAYKQQPIEEKESYRWISSSQSSQSRLSSADHITIIADRESDIYEEFVMIPDQRSDLLIRSRDNRCLYDRPEKLFDYLSSQDLAGTYRIKLKSDKRSNRQEREALIEVRYCRLKIKRPQNRAKTDLPAYVELYAIEARERIDNLPAGEKPVLWRLLTTHRVENFDAACQMISWYSLRWLIEQLFRTLKHKGLDLLSSQLEKGASLKKLTVMALQVAIKIMQLVQEREGKAGIDANVLFSEPEIDFLEKVVPTYEGKTQKQKNPYPARSLAWAAWAIARMGGWKGYKSEAKPGPITMKRGLQEFELMMAGWGLAELYFKKLST